MAQNLSDHIKQGVEAAGIISTADSEAIWVDVDENVGIGIQTPDGQLHVHSGTAGSVTASTNANDLVIENSGSVGLSFLSPDASASQIIYFGTPTQNNMGLIDFDPDGGPRLRLGTNKANGYVSFVVDTLSEAMRITASGNVGIGIDTPLARLHIYKDAIAVPTLSTNGDDFLISGNGAVGMTICSDSDDEGSIYFADPEDGDAGAIKYNHSTNSLSFRVNNVEGAIVIDSDGNVGVGNNNPGNKFSVKDDNAGYITYIKNENTAGFGLLVDAGTTSDHKILGLRTNVGTDKISFYADGSASFSNDIEAVKFNATSLTALKENIQAYTASALELISQVDIVSFNFINDETKEPRVGFLADDTDSTLAGPEHKSMDLANTTGVLLKAIQELTSELTSVHSRLDAIGA